MLQLCWSFDHNLFSDCKCDVRGTEDGSRVCDENGQCRCKQYATGLQCGACLSGFFRLNANNTDGNNECVSRCYPLNSKMYQDLVIICLGFYK